MAMVIVESVNLTCKFNDSSALSISEDDHIAVLSEIDDLSGFPYDPYSSKRKGGVHILLCDGRPNQSSMKFAISKVETPIELFSPAFDMPKNIKQYNDGVDFIFDQALGAISRKNDAGKSANTKEHLNTSRSAKKSKNADPEFVKPRVEQRGPRQAKWSPKSGLKNGRCLLAVLWLDHRLVIYGDYTVEHGWNEVVDISELWKTQMKNFPLKIRKFQTAVEPKALNETERLKETCYMQAAVAVAWSSRLLKQQANDLVQTDRLQSDHLIDDGLSFGAFYFFAVALKSGCIVLWKVQLPAVDERNFKVFECLDGDSPANELLFIPFSNSLIYLCKGNLNGMVLLYALHLEDGSLDWLENEQPFELWSDVDKMAVTGLSWNSERSILIATKGHTVVIWKLDNLDSGQPVVAFRKSPAVSFDFGIHCTVSIKDDLIFAGLEGGMYRTSLNHLNEMSDSDSFLPLRVMDVPWNNKELKINGMVPSRNGVFLVVALCPASYFCHLAHRDPFKVNLVSLATLTDVSNLVLNSMGSLLEVNDALTYLKWVWQTKHQWTDEIADLISKDNDKWLTYTSHRLKLVRTFLLIQISFWKEDETEKESCKKDLASVEELIIYRHVQRSLDHFVENASSTELELRSLSVMVTFLKKRGDSIVDDSDRINKISQKFSLNPEICAICKTQITFSSHLNDACSNGHSFSRCCQTLLFCDAIPYRSCSLCGCLAYAWDPIESSNSTYNFLQTNLCTYCDGLLV